MKLLPHTVLVAALVAVTLTLGPVASRAQDEPGDDLGIRPVNPAAQSDPMMPPPMAAIHIREQVTGSMMASPPYGIAPMRVGFFVLADDPEGIGFLTYSWDFGDGTVSALPPELYIFHTYRKPGNYLCELTVKTVDGRSKTFMQGVLVKPPGS